MSEQDNPSDRTSHTLTAVLVESVSSKQLPRVSEPTDDDTALHQKYAPALANIDPERHGSQKHGTKKLASSKRRDLSPATRKHYSSQTELKMDEIVVVKPTLLEPIPLGQAVPLDIEKKEDKKKQEEDADSITSEIKELRTPEPTNKTPEWSDEEEAGGLPRSESRASRSSRVTRVVRHLFCCGLQLEAPSEDNDTQEYTSNDTVKDEEDRVPLQRKLGNEILTESLIMDIANEDVASTSSDISKKKEITWSEETYLANVTLQNLGARSTSWMLERKASVGPCYRQGMPFGAPSGITVCLPKKPVRYTSCALDKGNPMKSGISVIISKTPCDSKLKLFGPVRPVQFEMRRAKVSAMRQETKNNNEKIKEDSYGEYYSTFRGKLDNFYGKIKHALHI